ncbi:MULTISPECIES: sulfatase [unclassified Lentimonas]|uniref:sulfatase n=1 Tax=unclassified Lentimonas TaxID=2630993 RepID=UPI00132BC679|nr:MULTISPECIES: sulfatase [unclassified Lentimonas]CAA6693094.1 N-acetylgalactosamine-6-sulfatase [Lentimonas sp. CC19]CAA6695667.1 N-acetylgalactosamine-6-sulfatase [Lentimonas sp. CC10]CAA7071522.1 N-acetylgalactosamine-6-sulfatase [Lentimonas sp. CC11]
MKYSKTLLLVLSVMLTPSLSTVGEAATAEQPNIIVFLVDDMGWQDTSLPFLYEEGKPVKTPANLRYRTPNMEVFATQGMLFTDAYAQPVCSPSRVTLLTGKSAARHEVTNWVKPNGQETGWPVSPEHWRRQGVDEAERGKTLPDRLSDAGYRTILCGKAHFGSMKSWAADPLAVGFEVNIGGSAIGLPGSYYANGEHPYGKGTDRAVPGLEKYHGSETFLTEALTLEFNAALEQSVQQGKRFYGYMAHYALHSPWNSDPRFASHYKNDSSMNGSARAYATLIEGMDKSLGDIIQKLEDLEIAEETLIFFMSDNGGENPMGQAPLRERKGSLYEGGIRVPLMVAWAKPNPQNPLQQQLPIPQDSVNHHLVHIVDLVPTILARAGVSLPEDAIMDGYDLGATLSNPSEGSGRQSLLIHFPHDRKEKLAGTVYRKGDWKLVYRYQTAQAELFNLKDDVGEANDLSQQYPEKVSQMLSVMKQQLESQNAQYPIHLKTKQSFSL